MNRIFVLLERLTLRSGVSPVRRRGLREQRPATLCRDAATPKMVVPFLVASIALLGICWPVNAATPPVEQLLPADTLGVFSIPDWDKATAYLRQSPFGKLWEDPVLKPFKEKFLKSFQEDVVVRLEKELGVKLADYTSLVHGQITFAVIQSGWDGRSEKKPGVFLLIDTKDQSERLKNQLTEVKKKWVDSGRQLKTDKIREVDFTTLLVRSEELSRTLEKAFPSAAEPADDPADKSASDKKEAKFEITFGQSDSLLIIGNTIKDVEKLLIRQSGGLVPTLAELPAYEANHNAMFRDALAFGWIHFKPIYEVLLHQNAGPASAEPTENPLMPKQEKVLAATGLGGLQTIALKAGGAAEGSLVELFLSVTESSRQGVFKLLAAEPKESSPPAFIPADAVKFNRWRIDGQKAWATLEAMLTAMSPEMAGLLQMTLSTVGKDKDPEFDLKKNLIGNLGDDFMSYEKNPRSSTTADLTSPPALYLIGSPNPEKLTLSLKAGTSIFPTPVPDESLKEREFLGRKIYSIPLPSMPGTEDSKAVKQSFSFAASGGYLALSTDAALVEEFLRSSEAKGKSLQETAGLAEAAQKVGGMNTGIFGYENQSEGFRIALETLKSNAARLNKILSLTSIGEKLNPEAENQNMKEWFDLSLLPPFDQLAKYFHFVVYAGGANASGLSWKLFAPTPPQITK